MAHLEDDLNQQNHNHYYGVGGLRTIKAFFANYVNFTGKSNRREFWWTTLFETVFLVILLFSAGAIVVQHVLKVINSGTSPRVVALRPARGLSRGFNHSLGRDDYPVVTFACINHPQIS